MPGWGWALIGAGVFLFVVIVVIVVMRSSWEASWSGWRPILPASTSRGAPINGLTLTLE